MGKKKKDSGLVAVYVRDTKNYHVYMLVGEITGTLYFPKDGEVPGDVVINLLTQSDGNIWKEGIEEVLSKTFAGGKTYAQIKKTLDSYKG